MSVSQPFLNPTPPQRLEDFDTPPAGVIVNQVPKRYNINILLIPTPSSPPQVYIVPLWVVLPTLGNTVLDS